MPNRSVIGRVAAAVVTISSVGFALVATLGVATSANGFVAVDRQPGGARQSVLAIIAMRTGEIAVAAPFCYFITLCEVRAGFFGLAGGSGACLLPRRRRHPCPP